jgi:phosphotransferase system enzyme I (PtsI)
MKTERPRSETAQATREQVLTGLGVAPGIAIGPAYVVDSSIATVPEYTIAPGDIDDETRRFADAVDSAHRQIADMETRASLGDGAGEDIALLLAAHRKMLSDSRLLRGALRRIVEERRNAESAIRAEVDMLAAAFAALDDPYIAARGLEVRDVGNRLLRHLLATPVDPLADVPAGAVIVADEISPADTALLDPARTAGLASVAGGAEGHSAILARALGLPAVLGVADLLVAVRRGETVIVDGDAGRIIVAPAEATLEEYRNRIRARAAERRGLSRLRRLPAISRDGLTVGLHANIELPRETERALRAGAEGIGLVRSEFLFMNRHDLPDEDEQYEAYASIVRTMDGRPVTLRTLDIGGEKLAFPLADLHGASANPALGLRAIRLSLRAPELFDAQLGAMLRAGAHGPTRLLLPMVVTPSEVRQARERLMRVARRLRRRHVPIADPLPPLGVMIEVPGAALGADALAQVADFFAIGTNDLTMYTLAIDRGDERVAHLYDPLHPAVLRLIQFATQAALRGRIPVSLCGEMAGDPTYAPLLVGLGIRELSMAPISLLRVKRRIRALDMGEAIRRTEMIMMQADASRVATLLADFNELLGD